MASVACADSVALARSAALTCAAATLLSIWRRILPQISGAQEALPSTVYCVRATPPPPPEDAPPEDEPPPPPPRLRVTPAFTPTVGNSDASVSRTSAVAAR